MKLHVNKYLLVVFMGAYVLVRLILLQFMLYLILLAESFISLMVYQMQYFFLM